MEDKLLYKNPYVEQIEKYADSLKQLSYTFLRMEEKKKILSQEEIETMFERVREKVCTQCGQYDWCWGENFIHTHRIGYEILSAIDRYGNELNVEVRRKLQQRCTMASLFLKEMLEAFHEARQTMMWNNRIALSREGCAIQMDTFAEMIRTTAKELQDSVVTDERLQKKLSAILRKKGVRLLKADFFMNREGKYEVHVTARTMQDRYMTVKELSRELSLVTGRQLLPKEGQVSALGREYTTVICAEGQQFYTLHGVARIGKDLNSVSGDNFMIVSLPGGRQAVALSDGMGSGEKACRESTLVIELLEELLEAGFPERAAIRMINTTLVMGREEIHYSTVDMSVFDLYAGTCELIKAGASSTFIKSRGKVEHLTSTSLPIGVMHRLEIDSVQRKLYDGDFIIMITDGVMDALPVGEQDLLLETIIQGSDIMNPKEMAHHILEQVLNWNDEPPQDDMTVLVIGIWEK